MNDMYYAHEARRRGCKACSWYAAHADEPGVGDCRAAPPRTSSIRFPSVAEDEWCAAWVPAPLDAAVAPAEPAEPEVPAMGEGERRAIERAYGYAPGSMSMERARELKGKL